VGECHSLVSYAAILIDGPPQLVMFAVDGEKDFVQVPLGPRSRISAAQLIAMGLPEFLAPIPHSLIGHADLGSAISSSTSRYLGQKRQSCQTQWLIISAGKRWRVCRLGVGGMFTRRVRHAGGELGKWWMAFIPPPLPLGARQAQQRQGASPASPVVGSDA
jgi:hypothetical protein